MLEKPYIPSQAEMEKAETMAADYQKTPEQVKEDEEKKDKNNEALISDLAGIEIYGSNSVSEQIKQNYAEMAIKVITDINKSAGKKLSWTFRLFGPKSDKDMKFKMEETLNNMAAALRLEHEKAANEVGLIRKRGDNTEMDKFIAERELERKGLLKSLKEGYADFVLNKDEGTIQIGMTSDGYKLKSGELMNFDEITKYIRENM
ncbi:MAG: hypothetical protein UX49_C0049G0001 [Candidatus Wolfebacteria bacterium GW2011_GWC2_46_275]|uniref:Uncharacterized protein n=2 Tax=Candidatus Wolfeibacteriota TaxID=1752735 RepID=A0A0G1U5I5_9BACT|nr:MAG: hypothetical protein UX70_C0001G0126 [Candidatus Wolfebacteria bacterium GW2011_GWB1_47_1]KKU34407.1 MAG: hypothetical protein UX49_C0049G0001 [Candidatus Wolfebacteria bacterium GW2011_GWC2_46_275]KKU41564.1 MAG: hypothetical protein UX58_C0007G0005 [Candidatus Wolfebacteria bacterium GW2011_GWB2_46_69]KKU53521.1 MAG: hypothetical protein UX76_C0014G0017 [Candidatus Wolfebacteria bacterium GW2011_GWC1_47_103]KKU59854.1 MAG: hypothetical protein UX83_C0002G0141 [Candidatus Wolfebacteria